MISIEAHPSEETTKSTKLRSGAKAAPERDVQHSRPYWLPPVLPYPVDGFVRNTIEE